MNVLRTVDNIHFLHNDTLDASYEHFNLHGCYVLFEVYVLE